MPQISDSDSPAQVTEHTGLLHGSETGPSSKCSGDELTGPMPAFQIFLLCFSRAMEPITFFCIFPYIAEMVQRNGHLADSEVGLYSGLLESVFSVTQIIFLLAWGNLADKIGRKPVLIASLAGMTVGQVLFGLSTSLWEMILFRALTGVFSCANLITRTMIGEICPPGAQAKAFSWYSTGGNLAGILGPLLGGVLVDPAHQYPSLFGGIAFLEKRRYALPGFLVGSLSFTAVAISAVLLKETLPTRPGKDEAEDDDDAPQLTLYQTIGPPNIFSWILAYGYIAFLAFSFLAVVPVVLYTTVDLGGFGFSTMQSTIYFTMQGLGECIWLLLVFPALHARIGTIGIVQACAPAFPCVFAAHIAVNALRRQGGHAAYSLSNVLIWILQFTVPGLWMSYTAVQLGLNEACRNSPALARINSIAEMLVSSTRCLAPPLFSSIFAIGVRQQVASGYLVWFILIAVALPPIATCRPFRR